MSVLLNRWTDFTKGDGGWLDKDLLQPGFFHGENVVVYRNGAVGPRSGYINLGHGGAPGGTSTPAILGYADQGDNTTDYVWMLKGNVVYRLPVYDGNGFALTGQTWAAASGATITGTFGIGAAVDISPQVAVFTVMGDRTYELNHQTAPNGGVTALTGSPGGRTMEIYNEFLLVAGTVSNPNRIHFCAPDNPNSWPAGNFIDVFPSIVTSKPSIMAMHRLRDQVLIWTNMGQLFILTGRMDNEPTLREFMPGDKMSGPFWQDSVARTREGRMFWTRREEVPALEDQIYDLPAAVPVSFTGAQRDEYAEQGGYLRQGSFAETRLSHTTAVAGRSEQSFALFDYEGTSYRALLHRGDAWTRHHFTQFSPYRLTAGVRGEVFAMEKDSPWDLRVWQFEMERPPWYFRGSGQEYIPTSTTDGPGNGIINWFQTPAFRHPSQQMMRVRRLEIILSSYTTNDLTSPNVTLSAYVQQSDTLSPFAETISAASQNPADFDPGFALAATPTYSELPATGGDQLRRRATIMLGANEIPCGSVQVLIKNMRDCAIHSIDLYGDLVPDMRP